MIPFLSSSTFVLRGAVSALALSLYAVSATAQSTPASAAVTDMYVYTPEKIAKGCADVKEDNLRNLVIAYLPDVERLYMEFILAAVPESELSGKQKTAGEYVFQNMFWLVTSPGDNPKYHENQFAMFYADMNKNIITAHAYTGVNNADSYKTMPALGVYQDAMTIIEANGLRKVIAYLDVSTLNNAYDRPEWTGAGFSSEAGIWFHTAYNGEFEYRDPFINNAPDATLGSTQSSAFGSARSAAFGTPASFGLEKTELAGFGAATPSAYTTSVEEKNGLKIVTIRGGGGGSTTTAATSGISDFGYSQQGPYADVTKGPAKNLPVSVPFTASPSAVKPAEPGIKDIQNVLDKAGLDNSLPGLLGRQQALAELESNEDLYRNQQFGWCTFQEDLADTQGLGPAAVQAVTISGTDGGFYDINAIDAECLSDIRVFFTTGPIVQRITATNQSGTYSIELEALERDLVERTQVFVLPNDNGMGRQFFDYGVNKFTLAMETIDGRTIPIERELVIPRP